MKIDAEATKKFGHRVYRPEAQPKEEPKTESKKAQKKASRDTENEDSERKNDFLRDE